MGRPPSNGGPAFRFSTSEVAEMEAILLDHKVQIPSKELILDIAEKFSQSADRVGKMAVQEKQVWNWFQNRRFALRSKLPRFPGKSNVTAMHVDDMAQFKNAPVVSQPQQPAPIARSVSESSPMEFEAKSARDGAWYDVQAFLSHRYLDTGDLEVRVQCAGFGADEVEWVNVNKHVRQRSYPCESTDCFVVMPGDLILCFQEGKEQALYFDAHVLDAQRRRHDARGCRCRFLVRYDHDLSEEIAPLRKICRRPETDYRLQLHPMNEPSPIVAHKAPGPVLKAAHPIQPMSASQKTLTNVSVGPVGVIPLSSNTTGTVTPGTIKVEGSAPVQAPLTASAVAPAPSETPK